MKKNNTRKYIVKEEWTWADGREMTAYKGKSDVHLYLNDEARADAWVRKPYATKCAKELQYGQDLLERVAPERGLIVRYSVAEIVEVNVVEIAEA